MPPSRSLPPLDCCLGTSPIHAEKLRPDRKVLGSATLATTGAIGPKDLERVAVDTVQPKAVVHPTDALLMHRAITKLVGLAKRNRVPLRQSYLRLAKRAAIMVGRYTHAHQFKRARRQLKFLQTRLGRIIRDIN